MLDFSQILNALGLVCSSKYTEKLKLLYILHLPPLLSKVEIEQVRNPKTKTKDDAEEAIEAEDFFGDDPSESIEALPSPTDNNFDENDYALITATQKLHSLAGITGNTFMDILRTPNLSTASNASSMAVNARASTFYVDLSEDENSTPGGGVGGATGMMGGVARSQNGSSAIAPLKQQGRFESIDTFSDISDLGATKVTPPQLNVETISNFSQISDLIMNTNDKRDRTDSNTDTKSLGSLRYLLDQPDDANSPNKNIPNMKKINFQILWRSLVEILGKSDADMNQACKYLCIWV